MRDYSFKRTRLEYVRYSVMLSDCTVKRHKFETEPIFSTNKIRPRPFNGVGLHKHRSSEDEEQ